MEKILNTLITSSDFKEPVTLKDYLRDILVELWCTGEGFSGKRPLGNSDWQYCIYQSISGKEEFTMQEAQVIDRDIKAAIRYLFI